MSLSTFVKALIGGLTTIMKVFHSNEKLSLNLLDSIEKIRAKTFFEIMKTDNLNLLNPKKEKVSERKLSEVWFGLREEYYKESDPRQYKVDLAKAKRIAKLENEILGCSAAIYIYELSGEINDAFKEYGYTVKNGKDVDKVKHKMLVRKTKLGLLTDNRKQDDEKEAIKFYKMATDLEGALNKLGLLNGQLNVEKIKLAQWVNYMNSIKKADGQNR